MNRDPKCNLVPSIIYLTRKENVSQSLPVPDLSGEGNLFPVRGDSP